MIEDHWFWLRYISSMPIRLNNIGFEIVKCLECSKPGNYGIWVTEYVMTVFYGSVRTALEAVMCVLQIR